MRTLVPALLMLASAGLAHAQASGDTTQTPDDARSATEACLSAVIDGAPVVDVEEGDIAIRRGKDPVSCTVIVSGGQPVVIREAMLQAIDRKGEQDFAPAKTHWDAGAFASREAFCNLSIRRNLGVLLSTGKPGAVPVAIATVFESPKRDERCDRDMGVQAVAETKPAEKADAASAPAQIETIAPPKPAPKKKSLAGRLSKVFGLGH